MLEARALLVTSQLAFMSACAVAAGGARPPASEMLEAVPVTALTVTSGSVLPLAAGGLAIRSPTVRAVADGSGHAEVELDFLYLGPSREVVPLASGEARRQIGLKLRARDTCNVIYVMWHIEPTTGIHVALKSNPGQRTHAQCSDRGYQTLAPNWPQVAVPAIRAGERRRLRATIEGDLLRVSADGVPVWTGRLPSEALALDGPVGLRTDNGEFDFVFSAMPGEESMNLRRNYAPLALVLSFGCGREKPADVADAAMGASTADPSAVCVDDQPALAALPPDAGACGVDGGAPAVDPGRPLGFGFPEGGDVLPAGVAFLTFDDGPSDWTAEILDILAAKGVHATFFINARNLKGPAGLDGSYTDAAGKTAVYRDLVKREVDEGHVIGNHTVDHKDLASLGVSDAAGELDLNEQLINAALVKTGGTPRVLTLIRPPFGSPWYHHAPLPADPVAAADTVGRLIANRGLDVMWTIDSSDSLEWAQGESYTRAPGGVTIDATVSYADKVARVESTVLTDPAIAAHKGAIILVHDTHNATRDAAAAIIDGLRAVGYTFGTIEELAQQRWGHPSLALTPGPFMWEPCVPQSDWGCAGATDAAHSVCGRLWRAYESAGGASKLGAPLGAPSTDATTGVTSQSFERGSLALHPESAAPCSATLSTTTP